MFWSAVAEVVSRYKLGRDPKLHKSRVDQMAWCGRLIGKFVGLHLARDPDDSADDALRCIMKFISLKAQLPQARNISVASAETCLTSAWTKNPYPKTDAALFEKFLVEYGEFSGDSSKRVEDLKPGRRLNTAILLFRHPTRPLRDPLLSVFRNEARDPTTRFFQPKTDSEALFKVRLARDLVTLLRERGRMDDMRWASGFLQLLEKILENLGAKVRDNGQPAQASKWDLSQR
ncbi:hypothetical protein LTR37_002058 [Vermiconidia calcicola]|uniref:Uncharacterized protein n=1 Tax=Vermiconidia calcicola TaxID=1690605 RepID=A0ACC3NTZ3_9PEZI|nr:hypothetical protein LTR37_002058 [Vermiconidia calcicola]